MNIVFLNPEKTMSLSNEEKALVEESLQVYLQLVARQMQLPRSSSWRSWPRDR